MNKIKQHQHIAGLIYKQQAGHISADESLELMHWLEESDANKRLYHRLIEKDYADAIQTYQDIDTQKAWQKYNKRYQPKSKLKPSILYIGAAACFAAVMILSIVLITQHLSHQKSTRLAAIIAPGTSKAILVLNDGETVDLTLSDNSKIVTSESTTANNTGSQLYYQKSKEQKTMEKEEAFNKIITPRGGEYKVILSDSTVVWLNAETTLRYPVRFSGDSREVFLNGEAYFEVKRDEKKSFCVHLSNDLYVEVLGTSFNVRAYADEDLMQTVLEKGKVSLVHSGNQITLKPSDLASYNMKTKEITKKKVDTELYTAWRTGRYVFHNESIETILQTLSRWYNIEPVFKNESIKNIMFTGNVKKYENVNPLLDAIETSGHIRFEIEGKTVHVFEK